MTVARASLAISCGFLAASAIVNFMFAFALAKTPLLAFVYGSVGILATAANAVIPLRMQQAWDLRRYSAIVAGAIFLPLCIMFSLASAIGFAASARDKAVADRATIAQNYQTTLAMLKDFETKPRTPKTEQRIEALREEAIRYRERGALQHNDPQAVALGVFGIADGRYYLTLLFALLVEVGSALGPFIALADVKRKEPAQWKPKAG